MFREVYLGSTSDSVVARNLRGLVKFLLTGVAAGVISYGLYYLMQGIYPDFWFWADMLLYLLVVGRVAYDHEKAGYPRKWHVRIKKYAEVAGVSSTMLLLLVGLCALEERFIGLPISAKMLTEGTLFIVLLLMVSSRYYDALR